MTLTREQEAEAAYQAVMYRVEGAPAWDAHQAFVAGWKYGYNAVAMHAVLQAESEPLGCPDAARMGKHVCTNRHQCWEPCGELGQSEEHARTER